MNAPATGSSRVPESKAPGAFDWRREWRVLAIILATLAGVAILPARIPGFDRAVAEGVQLASWYAREHTLLCLVPAFFIAGAIATFLNPAAVVRYLGPGASRPVAYGVASVSGTILSVCSCTVLPLFAGIHRMGAGLGPAVAFLYSGPAINVLAVILTARILGLELGLARALGAVLFAIVIGLAMAFLFRREEARSARPAPLSVAGEDSPPLLPVILLFASLIGILVAANWSEPPAAAGVWSLVHQGRWAATAAFAALLGVVLVRWYAFPASGTLLAAGAVASLALAFPGHPQAAFAAGTLVIAAIASRSPGPAGEWFAASWGFAKQILPLLLIGVLVAGFLLGRPGEEGLIPSAWVTNSVGGEGLFANVFAAFAGAFMYFATLTEVPILQGLIGSGMGKGPALALLLAGPALSLPSILVIRAVLGTQKTIAYTLLVVLTATISGLVYGRL